MPVCPYCSLTKILKININSSRKITSYHAFCLMYNGTINNLTGNYISNCITSLENTKIKLIYLPFTFQSNQLLNIPNSSANILTFQNTPLLSIKCWSTF